MFIPSATAPLRRGALSQGSAKSTGDFGNESICVDRFITGGHDAGGNPGVLTFDVAAAIPATLHAPPLKTP